MAATSFFASGPHSSSLPSANSNSSSSLIASAAAMAFDHQRMPPAPAKEMTPLTAASSPASKKVRLSATAALAPSVEATAAVAGPARSHQLPITPGDVQMGGCVGDKGIQTTPAAVLAAESCISPSSAAKTSPDATQRLQSIRTTISEQFDIEILLKHRELGSIEKEIAKTQVAMEQLRRCSLIPYADSTEAQLHAQLNYKPPSHNPHHIPDYAPAPDGVVDGPYTRHYRQWLIAHQRFDGPTAPTYVAPPPTPGLELFQSLADSGRPQRQSALKAQTKSGVQVCLYRKRDGTLVRLECGTCHRSNFSSAQGFINHCRIAHQTEYASHDAAADACGKEVDEEEQASLISPMLRTAIDGPARNTRQTQQQFSPAMPTPQSSYHSRSASFSQTPVNTKPPTPTTSTQRKGGRRAAMTVNTPKTPAPQHRGSISGSATSPIDFSTTNLESHLKRKRPDLNVEGLLKEVTEKVEWVHDRSRSPSLDFESEEDISPMGPMFRSRALPAPLPTQQHTPATSMPPTPTSQESSMDYRRSLSGSSPLPSRGESSNSKPQRISADGDVEMDDFDASSDDDDGGYRSDGAQGNDDDLYSVTHRRPMQGDSMEFRSVDSPTFGPMLGNGGIYSQFLQQHSQGNASPMSGFIGGTALLNGGGIPPAAPPPPAVTINPAVLMRNTDHPSPSPAVMNMAQITAALLDGAASMEPEVPKHVRFAMPGIGGDFRQEGLNGSV